MLTGIVLTVAMSATMVPPGGLVVNHAQPAHYGQPTIRTFERRAVDDLRRARWDAYVEELDGLWKQYRADGSTPVAWEFYKRAAADAKTRYVFGDPYLAPVVPGYSGGELGGYSGGDCW
jgi:hypothetical protein